MLTSILLTLIVIWVFARHKSSSIVYLPIYLAVFSSFLFIQLDTGFESASGGLRNIILTLFILYLFFFKPQILFHNIYIFLFLAYTFVLVFLSSDMQASLFRYFNVFIYLLMIPIGYYLINDERKIKILNRSTVILLIIFLLNFFFVNTLKVGRTLYTDDFYLGGFSGGSLYMAAIAVAIIPFILSKAKDFPSRAFLIIIAFASVIILALSLRRTAIILPLVGFIIYYLYSIKGIPKLIAIGAVFIALAYFTFPFFEDTFSERFELREQRFSKDFYEQEGRYLEYGIIFEESLDSYKDFFIGKEIFNSAGHYAGGSFGDRIIHSGFPAIIHGSGYIGLLLFIMIFVKIIKDFYKLRPFIKSYNLTPYSQLFISLFLLNIALTISGAFLEVNTRSLLYLYMGATIGTIEQLKLSISRRIYLNGNRGK